MSVGLLINPRAARGRGRGESLARRIAGSPEVIVRRLDHFAALDAILGELAAAKVTCLAISGGDGTVQAVVTALGEARAFSTPPALLLLKHGTTNMTAADLGFRSPSLRRQAAALLAPATVARITRPALRLVNPGDGRARQGFFLGAGALSHAVRFTQDAHNRRGIGGDWAPGLTLASALLGGKASSFNRPHAMTLTEAGQIRATGDQLLMLATTLDRLILGSRPFRLGEGSGPIRVTSLPHPTPVTARTAWRLLYGGEDRPLPEGARSFACSGFTLSLSGDLVLDGEMVPMPVGSPLGVETGLALTFLVG